MKKSVAICTFNGEKYIARQLSSILCQDTPVDEIVLCDDGSTDGTLVIVEEIKTFASIPIIIYQNASNLGVCANFRKAIELCHGDIIFLSDQDDVWLPEKVTIIEHWFEKNPRKEVVFTNAFLVNEFENSFTSLLLFDAVGFSPRAMKWFDRGFALELFQKNGRATGATMAIRKSFVPYMNIDEKARAGIPSVALHDECLSLSAIQSNSLGYISMPLIKYRIHEEQVCGLMPWIQNPRKSDNVLNPHASCQRKSKYLGNERMIARWNFMIERASIESDGKLFPWIFIHFLKYIKYYGLWCPLFLARDLAIAIVSRK